MAQGGLRTTPQKFCKCFKTACKCKEVVKVGACWACTQGNHTLEISIEKEKE